MITILSLLDSLHCPVLQKNKQINRIGKMKSGIFDILNSITELDKHISRNPFYKIFFIKLVVEFYSL